MNEDVFAILTLDEAKAFRSVKPLYRASFFHLSSFSAVLICFVLVILSSGQMGVRRAGLTSIARQLQLPLYYITCRASPAGSSAAVETENMSRRNIVVSGDRLLLAWGTSSWADGSASQWCARTR
jgi:hypothetical protein